MRTSGLKFALSLFLYVAGGELVGLSAVRRPFSVLRQFLDYAAEADNLLFGAGAMMGQRAGQVILTILLFTFSWRLGGPVAARA